MQEHVAEAAENRKGMNAYISGLDRMIKSNCDLLLKLGWDRKAIFYEKYD